jgi:cell wall assembly regulator SMI1
MHRPVGHTEVRQLNEAVVQLDVLLRDHEPDFAASLNPPASDAELDILRAAVEPYELTDELEILYRWHNGQDRSGAWWPILEAGPLLTTTDAAEHTRGLAEHCEPFQWSPAWVAITHSSWQQTAVQLSEPLQGLVIDASFPDPPRPCAISLAAVAQAVCRLIEAGVPFDDPTPPPGPNPDPQALRQYKAEVRATRRRINEALAVDRLLVLQWKYQ